MNRNRGFVQHDADVTLGRDFVQRGGETAARRVTEHMDVGSGGGNGIHHGVERRRVAEDLGAKGESFALRHDRHAVVTHRARDQHLVARFRETSGNVNPRNHFTETGGRDVETVAVSLFNHLRVTGHDLHARLMSGTGHRFDDLFKLRDFETFFEHEAGRDVERFRAAHGDVIHRTGNSEGSDIAAREEERTDHVSVTGNDRGSLDFREERAIVSLIENLPTIIVEIVKAVPQIIAALAARGIIDGKSDGSFDPEGSMTRAEFAAIVVRALGLTPEGKNSFSDVAAEAWYAPYVGTAYSCGIITGVGDGRFNPSGTITRQEAAVMVSRAAKLCGLETEMDNAATRNMLAQFPDYMGTAEWARAPLAFCYQEKILDQAELNIRPLEAVTRAEVAQMLFNLLSSANLL